MYEKREGRKKKMYIKEENLETDNPHKDIKCFKEITQHGSLLLFNAMSDQEP